MASMHIPTGIAHIEMIDVAGAAVYAETAKRRANATADCKLIGTALSALYQAATCHRKCHGGPHVLESLCGRIYNLGTGAFFLAERGLYDEALNLIRGVGEAGNLIALSVVDKDALEQWLTSDKKTRKNKFSPFEVRKALEKLEPRLLLADADWYTRFCEAYTHVTPQTRPNAHAADGQAHVGGCYQADGLRNTLGELATTLGSVTMIVCRYFQFDDLFDEIHAIVKGTAEGEDNPPARAEVTAGPGAIQPQQ